MQRLMWIGSMIPEDYYCELSSMGYKNQQASRIAQQNIIQGLEHYYGCKFDYVSGPSLPAYPRFKKIFIQSYSWSMPGGGCGTTASYANIEYINRAFKSWGMIRATKKMMKHYSREDNITVYVNSPHTPFIKAALKVKNYFPQAKLILIIPDLPQFMETNAPKIKRMLKSIDFHMMTFDIQKFDYYVLYSDKMREFLTLPMEKCVTMEGCAAEDDEEYKKSDSPHPFTFMYSGTADKKFGLNILVDAFMGIECNCKLIITGKGDSEKYIENAARKDKRIEYYGFLNDYSKVKQMQADADVLINMRLPSEPASAYCFPSKLFEYMKTGNPVISFRIDGIGQEYHKYLIMVDDESVDSLRKTMESVIKMDKDVLRKMGLSGKEFVLKEKNPYKQTEKIFNVVEHLLDEEKHYESKV